MYSRFSIKKNAGDKDIDIVDDVAGGLENSLNDALGGVEEETEETLQNSIEEAKERANAEIENREIIINNMYGFLFIRENFLLIQFNITHE